MKKFITAALLALCGLVFVSCGKSAAAVDSDGCYNDIDQALKAAKKTNTDVLVIITVDGDDDYSSAFLTDVVRTDSFKQNVETAYTVVRMDFSQTTYQATVAGDNATKKEKKLAEANAIQLQNNMNFANLLMPEYTPSVYLFSKDEYFLTDVNPNRQIVSAEDLLLAISTYDEVVAQVKAVIERTKTGTVQEKIKAIDELYEGTYPDYRVFLADLVEFVIKNDKNNECGLVSKYLMADAENSSLAFIAESDVENAVKAYTDICANPLLEPKDKQQAYYMAAYLLAYSGSDDQTQVIQYLQYAVQSYPEGEDVPAIQAILDRFAAAYYSEGSAQ